MAAGQSIADQLLVNSPSPSSMDNDLSLDVGPSRSGAALEPKSADAPLMGSTPLDDCLAQLTSETAPSLRIPGSDGEALPHITISLHSLWQMMPGIPDLRAAPSSCAWR